MKPTAREPRDAASTSASSIDGSSRRSVEVVLAGGGEMGALMRSMDWAATALGPVEGWPQSLRTSVSTCLNSRFPIMLFWGSDLVQLYNDAYRPILGNKHPSAMGWRSRETWPELWHIIGPMLERVLTHGDATWSDNQLLSMERHGFVENCYFTFSYSPVHDESGGIGGVFCAVIETTRQVLGERRLRTLRDLAARVSMLKREAEAWQIFAEALQSNPHDLPFALLFRADATGSVAHRVATAGVAPVCWGASVDLTGGSGAAFLLAPDAKGRRQEVQDDALVLPISRPGGAPFGLLVAGISTRHLLDDDYRGFLGLVADQIAAGIATVRAYDEERTRAEALAELDRAKTTFFSNVSHEFRTPLTLILSPIEDGLADTKSPLPAVQRERMELVRRNGLRLQKLVNTLLDFARLEADRAQAFFVPTDLAALTADLASGFRSVIEAGSLSFIVESGVLPEAIHVDPSMWEKIVLNLLSNAFKFTFDGTIAVRLHANGDQVELSVQDTGVGIPPAELTRVFDRFRRVEGMRSRTHEGSGIGLALVRDLVKLHGGDVRVESEVGQGTTFTVSIPTDARHLPAERIGAASTVLTGASGVEPFVMEAERWLSDRSSAEPPPAADMRGAARILVVDDNTDMRAYVTRLLREHWTVEAAADGAQALEAARRDPPDLVLTDVMMPVMDGFQLVRALRADPRTKTIPIIALSARAGEEAAAEGLRTGADDYIAKPFSASTLLARVESALASARLRFEANAAVELERSRLYALFMDGPALICVLRGDDLVIELANQNMLDIWGKTDAVVGKPLLEGVTELRGQGFDNLLHEVMRSGIPYRARATLAWVDKSRDGILQDVYFDFVYSPMREADGRISGALVFAFDVSEQLSARRAAETARAEAEQAKAEAEAANRAKDEFLAMLGHELRNPLAPILTALELMSAGDPPSDELARAVIHRQVGHLVRLVDDLLDVSRIAQGQVALKKQVVELAVVVAKAIEMASPLIEQFEQNLTVDVASVGLAVDGDVNRLAQVVSNLLTNAAKYTGRGGAITIRGAREGAQVSLSVSDTGVGIAPEMLPRVFDMFVQERQSIDRSRGGLGLGLAIVRNFVKAHGGTTSVRSEGRGRGSVFTVSLPTARSVASSVAEETPSRLPSVTSERLHILVVDDNEDAATMLTLFLRKQGHVIRVAHDGPSALRAAAELVPDVALLDLGLPVMDGFELARRLREAYGHERLRLVAVTGYGQDKDRDQSREAGFDLHLVKPVNRDLLRVALGRFVAERARATGAASPEA